MTDILLPQESPVGNRDGVNRGNSIGVLHKEFPVVEGGLAEPVANRAGFGRGVPDQSELRGVFVSTLGPTISLSMP